MILFIIKRLFQAVIVMWVISLVGFLVKSRLGNPIEFLLPQSASEATKHALAVKLGLLDPWYVQYGHFLKGVLHFNFGTSFFYHAPTLQIILEKFPATFELVLLTAVIIVFVAIPLGVITAVFPTKWYSKVILALSVTGLSIPVFFIAILLVWFFAIFLNILPAFGRGDTIHLFGSYYTNFLTISGWKHIILPASSLAIIISPLFIRLVRSEMVEALASESIRFAMAKGMPLRNVWFKHALKQTLLPVITVGGLQLGMLLAFTILTETVFQWPGVGFMFLQAVQNADIELIVSYIMFVGFIFVCINTIVDILYYYLNPTVQTLEN